METDLNRPYASARTTIHASQIEQSFRQLPISLIVNLVNGLILVIVLWGAVSAPLLVIWLGLLIAVTDARVVIMRAFRQANLKVESEAVWSRYFTGGACAAGIVWGAAGIILFPPDAFPYQVFLAFVLGGMVAGAVPLLSSIDRAFEYFAIPILVPISIRLLSEGDYLHSIMGMMIGIFGIAMLAAAARVRRLFNDLERLRRQLLSSLRWGRELEHLIRLDALTEIPNRRLFEEELEREWKIAARNHETIAVIIADIDYFKEYNDHYGHPAGDRCLIKVAQTLQSALLRPGDVVARIGGEEFAFLLPRTSTQGAVAVAEHIRAQIQTLDLSHEASSVASRVTLSFGVASTENESIASTAGLIRAADTALFEAKRRGRNRIMAEQDTAAVTHPA